jgi:hypothetical protein
LAADRVPVTIMAEARVIPKYDAVLCRSKIGSLSRPAVLRESDDARVFVEQAAQDGSPVDPPAVEAGDGEMSTVGDALGNALRAAVL